MEADTRPDVRRRVLNWTVALASLVVVGPAMGLIALTIRATSPGPILYRQSRVGLDRRSDVRAAADCRRKKDLGGRPFTIYKFRTMRHTLQGDGEQVWASPDDPRVTALGRVLRRYRLDELPQLLNVLQGDMNIVGPRPEQPEIVRELRSRVEGYQRRHRVLPGITGWAQINQHYDTCLDDVKRKVVYDLEYLERASILTDLAIMARTVPVVLTRKGAW